MKRFALFFLMISPFFALSQKRLNLVHHNAFAFYDYQEKVFCVLDDSTFLWKYDSKKQSWRKDTLHLNIDTNFTQFLAEYVPLSEKGSDVYFVHAGCGVVYQLKNNSVVRHDRSFQHKNQFSGAYFMDNGEPHIYGGYGLFTTKNIITRYDTTEREWFFVNTVGNRPPNGMSNIIQKSNGEYFLFDGVKDVNGVCQALKSVCKFNKRTKRWMYIGRLNPEIANNYIQNPINGRCLSDRHISIFSDKLVSFNLKTLQFTKFPLKSMGTFAQIIEVGNQVLLYRISSKMRYIEMTDLNFWKKFKKEEGSMLILEEGNPNAYWRYVLVTIVLSLIAYFYFIKGLGKKAKYHESGMNSQLMEEFHSTEKKLLHMLKEHELEGLEISFINDLVNHDQPSMDTLKKRRELLIKDLRYKLAAKFNLTQEEVFIERRMETDKRMKLLFLNEQIVKSLKKLG